ncbi:phosphatase PAP2 family protein [Microbacterium lacus]|uniref:phosphatase PAP2 family protein n=1 Tax=Microbacterium lacus TaxID=415217 RepID=UPI00384AE87E
MRPSRYLPSLVTGIVLIALSCGLGAWLYSRGDVPFAGDLWWNTLLVDSRNAFLLNFSYAMDFLGGHWFGIFVVPLGGTLVLILVKRPWSAAYFLVAQAVSAGLVQVLKRSFGRARPEEILVISDYGSFPSGHVAGAATLATAVIVLFPRLWVIIAGVVWVLAMAFSRTYLHAHWLSDTLGGALAGVGAALVVAALFAVPLDRERARARAPELTASLTDQ